MNREDDRGHEERYERRPRQHGPPARAEADGVFTRRERCLLAAATHARPVGGHRQVVTRAAHGEPVYSRSVPVRRRTRERYALKISATRAAISASVTFVASASSLNRSPLA